MLQLVLLWCKYHTGHPVNLSKIENILYALKPALYREWCIRCFCTGVILIGCVVTRTKPRAPPNPDSCYVFILTSLPQCASSSSSISIPGWQSHGILFAFCNLDFNMMLDIHLLFLYSFQVYDSLLVYWIHQFSRSHSSVHFDVLEPEARM